MFVKSYLSRVVAYPVMQRTFCAKGVCDLLCVLLVGQMRLGGLGMAKNIKIKATHQALCCLGCLQEFQMATC